MPMGAGFSATKTASVTRDGASLFSMGRLLWYAFYADAIGDISHR